MGRHPDHDAVAGEVRSWYTDWPGRAPGPAGSTPDIGVVSSRESFGYLRNGPGRWDRRVVLTIDDPRDLSSALAAGQGFYGSPAFDVWIDDRSRAAVLEPALLDAGFDAPEGNTVVLALIGPLHTYRRPVDMEVREVTDEADLETWCRVKLMAFSNSEERPGPATLDNEVAARQAERSIARYEMGVCGAEPAGVLAHYTASIDQMVFLLGTRLPFRHRGVAQGLLKRWCDRAQSEGARSLLINCEEGGQPSQLYRRMGFNDEVYWHRRYERHLATDSAPTAD